MTNSGVCIHMYVSAQYHIAYDKVSSIHNRLLYDIACSTWLSVVAEDLRPGPGSMGVPGGGREYIAPTQRNKIKTLSTIA